MNGFVLCDDNTYARWGLILDCLDRENCVQWINFRTLYWKNKSIIDTGKMSTPPLALLFDTNWPTILIIFWICLFVSIVVVYSIVVATQGSDCEKYNNKFSCYISQTKVHEILAYPYDGQRMQTDIFFRRHNWVIHHLWKICKRTSGDDWFAATSSLGK